MFLISFLIYLLAKRNFKRYPNVDFTARGKNWKRFFQEKDGIYELKTKEEYEKV